MPSGVIGMYPSIRITPCCFISMLPGYKATSCQCHLHLHEGRSECNMSNKYARQQLQLSWPTCRWPAVAAERLPSSAKEDPIALLPLSSWLCRLATVLLTSSVLRCVNDVSIVPICCTSLAWRIHLTSETRYCSHDSKVADFSQCSSC